MALGEEAIVELDAEDLSKMQDLWAKLPEEVQQKIFKHLRWRQLFRICAVCKSFNDGINRYVHELPLFRTAVPLPQRDEMNLSEAPLWCRIGVHGNPPLKVA